eukprot:TRINITY_DN31023_c0_g1_i1.p1 TRINITY_DN31023_c0_g1~~TRINITY_DN31023_c0_g1_i1.p1  ORF type:complete len:452 (+),score=26.55 TRINITY_DN31023_c0_g1_i1:54-1409(+)
MPRRKDKIPPPGLKKDPYTNFMKKTKWQAVLRTQTLDLSGRNIQKEGAVTVAHALLKNIFVTNLNLTQNHLGDAGATEFAQMLKVNNNIRTLNVGINDLTDVGGVMLAAAFLINKTLTSFSAPGNSLEDDTATAFAHVLKNNREIKHVDLSWNAIATKGAKSLASVLAVNNDVIISLFQNRIGDEGCKALCENLKQYGRETLHQHVNWWQDDIGKAGALAIGEMLDANPKLMSLNLSWNSLGDAGTEAIAKAMQTNVGTQLPFCQVLTINLCQNIVGDKAAQAFGGLLALDAPLQTLNLSHNVITAEGAITIAEGLKTNGHLTSLNLAHNKIGDPAAPPFAEVVSTTSTLQALWLQRNEMKEEAKNIISQSIPKNTKMRINYGALDDLTPYGGHYGTREPEPMRRTSRKYSSVSAVSSLTDSSRKGPIQKHRKSVSRGSTLSDSTASTTMS